VVGPSGRGNWLTRSWTYSSSPPDDPGRVAVDDDRARIDARCGGVDDAQDPLTGERLPHEQLRLLEVAEEQANHLADVGPRLGAGDADPGDDDRVAPARLCERRLHGEVVDALPQRSQERLGLFDVG
jgi:hypothetical protein